MRPMFAFFAATIILAAPADAAGKPAAGSKSPAHATGQQVPPLECESSEERRRAQEAELRRANRLAERDQIITARTAE